MSIIKEFVINNILQYEMNNDINILEELQYCNISIIIDLIMIGNKCSYEDALNILDIELRNREITDICEEIAYSLLGKEQDDNNDEYVENSENLSISDILHNYYNELQIVDDKLTITEFISMSTKFMFKYSEGIKQRYIYEKNKKYRDEYDSAAMILSGLAGKLKECPQLDKDGKIHKDNVKDKLLKFKTKGSV
jgi:hypothetical protein